MQDFYPAILKFAIVAALALAFIGVTYLPQQEAQKVMGDNMTKALSSVKEIIDEDGMVDASAVITEVSRTCKTGNTTTIYVKISTNTYEFKEDTGTGTNSITSVCSDLLKQYKREVSTNSITFTQQ